MLLNWSKQTILLTTINNKCHGKRQGHGKDSYLNSLYVLTSVNSILGHLGEQPTFWSKKRPKITILQSADNEAVSKIRHFLAHENGVFRG